jgi:hypothetical protein
MSLAYLEAKNRLACNLDGSQVCVYAKLRSSSIGKLGTLYNLEVPLKVAQLDFAKFVLPQKKKKRSHDALKLTLHVA